MVPNNTAVLGTQFKLTKSTQKTVFSYKETLNQASIISLYPQLTPCYLDSTAIINSTPGVFFPSD